MERANAGRCHAAATGCRLKLRLSLLDFAEYSIAPCNGSSSINLSVSSESRITEGSAVERISYSRLKAVGQETHFRMNPSDKLGDHLEHWRLG